MPASLRPPPLPMARHTRFDPVAPTYLHIAEGGVYGLSTGGMKKILPGCPAMPTPENLLG